MLAQGHDVCLARACDTPGKGHHLRREALWLFPMDRVPGALVHNEPHFIPPRPGYVETIEAGYRDWDLPTGGLERAKERQEQEYGITV